MYSWMSEVRSSPAVRMELFETMPPSEMTAISVLPPPMSTIMLPSGASTSMPMPMAAAMGSKMRYTSRPSACSAESRTARSSTSVLPDGTPMTMRREGEKRRLPVCTILMSPRIICSQAVKSAITPSRRGRMVRMLSCVFSYIIFAFSPTASILSVRRSSATTEGSSTTILSSLTMMVLAVPRSIAISCMNEKNPISSFAVFCSSLFVLRSSLTWRTTRGWRCRSASLRQRRALQTSCGLRCRSVRPSP